MLLANFTMKLKFRRGQQGARFRLNMGIRKIIMILHYSFSFISMISAGFCCSLFPFTDKYDRTACTSCSSVTLFNKDDFDLFILSNKIAGAKVFLYFFS